MLWLGVAGLASNYFYSSELIGLFSELRNIHQSECPAVRRIFLQNFLESYSLCRIINQCIFIVCGSTFLLYIVLGLTFSYYVLNQDYPLPAIYNISFCSVSGVPTYFINLLVQIILLATTINTHASGGCLLVYVLLMSQSMLQITAEIADKMNDASLEVEFDDWIKIVIDGLTTSKGYLFKP